MSEGNHLNESFDVINDDCVHSIGELAGHGNELPRPSVPLPERERIAMTAQQNVDMGSMPGVSSPIEEAEVLLRHQNIIERAQEIIEKDNAIRRARKKIFGQRARGNKARRGW